MVLSFRSYEKLIVAKPSQSGDGKGKPRNSTVTTAHYSRWIEPKVHFSISACLLDALKKRVQTISYNV